MFNSNKKILNWLYPGGQTATAYNALFPTQWGEIIFEAAYRGSMFDKLELYESWAPPAIISLIWKMVGKST